MIFFYCEQDLLYFVAFHKILLHFTRYIIAVFSLPIFRSILVIMVTIIMAMALSVELFASY